MNAEERLHEMTERLGVLRERLAQFKGEKKQILKQMAELDVKDTAAARRLLRDLETELVSYRERLGKLLEKLEEEYKW